jgi:hypothetical protein
MKYAKLGKDHAYLGHFRECLKTGHNTNEMPADPQTPPRTLKDVIKGDLPKKDASTPTVPPKPQWPGGVRG